MPHISQPSYGGRFRILMPQESLHDCLLQSSESNPGYAVSLRDALQAPHGTCARSPSHFAMRSVRRRVIGGGMGCPPPRGGMGRRPPWLRSRQDATAALRTWPGIHTSRSLQGDHALALAARAPAATSVACSRHCGRLRVTARAGSHGISPGRAHLPAAPFRVSPPLPVLVMCALYPYSFSMARVYHHLYTPGVRRHPISGVTLMTV